MRDLAEGVGRVIISFSLLEHDLTIVLAKILRLTVVKERAVIRPMSISNKITLLRALHRDYGKKGETDRWLKHLLKEIKHCADCRNDLAHSFYAEKKGKFVLLTFSESAKLSGHPVAWTPLALDHLVDRISILRRTLPNVPGTFPKNLRLPKIRPTSEPSVFETGSAK